MALKRESDFDAWFQELFLRAVGTAQRLLGSWAASEDVTAEAFARALERWRHVRDLGHRDAWLMRVVTNLAIDDLRRKPLPAKPLNQAPDEIDAVGERLALGEALARLSKRQREAIVLRYVGQLSEREVADALHLSPGTVKTHLRRGLTALRANPDLVDKEMIDALLDA